LLGDGLEVDAAGRLLEHASDERSREYDGDLFGRGMSQHLLHQLVGQVLRVVGGGEELAWRWWVVGGLVSVPAIAVNEQRTLDHFAPELA
jgi:hypothetical protein